MIAVSYGRGIDSLIFIVITLPKFNSPPLRVTFPIGKDRLPTTIFHRVLVVKLRGCPRKLRCPLKRDYEHLIFRGHVSFRRCSA